MPLQIVHFDHAVLRRKGALVTTFDPSLRRLATEMTASMHDAHGIGLAAQQIGEPLQLCVIDLRAVDPDFDWRLDGARPPLELIMPMTLVNPQVTVSPLAGEDIYEEGCLSFPEIRGDVKRPDRISVTYSDEHGVPHALECTGLFARCVQHEVDHLNGVLFIDRMTKRVRHKIDDAVKELARQTRATGAP
ncbi:peptide deformylase [Horticoccus luteus]|uniref:Peptide deformylase n=1 Tax=Horticoccus luteus TaxID=2862869 RepID=A0A8F9TVG9_9BACT|nr:peptide deformylase [Horticoccus luteus]QYM79830.1 peptide deformylase [Horticoccus luteus]